MADQRNHSFTSSFKIKKFLILFGTFSTPVIIVMVAIEIALRFLNYSESVKSEFIHKNSEKIEVLFLGSSQIQRAINPEHLQMPAINLANSSQRLYEDFQLLQYFQPKLKNLKLVVLEVSYERLHRDKSFTSPVIDHVNLAFYNVNSFGRSLKIQDYLLFHSNPEYFSGQLYQNYFSTPEEILNKYGYDVNKYGGSYKYADYNDDLIKDDDIFIENVYNPEEYKKNVKLFYEVLDYCLMNNMDVLLYSPATHSRFNNLRNNKLVAERDLIIQEIQSKYDDIKVLIDEEDPDFKMKHFYNANHLNPDGAELATKKVNDFILKNYY
jgi:hypothetical protein